MPYDAEDDPGGALKAAILGRPIKPADGRDPKTISTLCELAALELTTAPGVTFTRDTLVSIAREFWNPEIELRDADIDAALPGFDFLRQHDDGSFSLR